MPTQQDKERMPESVQDRKAEIGINLGVLFQALILMAISGFGWMAGQKLDDLTKGLEQLGKNIAATNVQTAVLQSEVRHNSVNIGINANGLSRTTNKLDEHITRYPRWENKK